MLDVIRRYFRDRLDPVAAPDDDPAHQLQLATAALLFEVSRVDNVVSPEEREAIMHAVTSKFALDAGETDELMELAQREAEDSSSYYAFTSLINAHFTATQKERVIEYMWRVAIADRHIDPHQEALVRKIADLLYLPHSAYIRSKLRVLDEDLDQT